MAEKEEIFNELLRDYQDKIYRLCCYYVKNEEDRKDLLNDIYYRIWRNLYSFKHRSSISTWIFRISVNSCIDFIRKETKRKHVMANVEINEETAIDKSENIEKDFIASERIQMLYSCIDRLSLLDKTLISLYLEELSYKEIAEIVGITEKNVGVKLFRIKKSLNEFLKDFQ